MRPHAPIDSTLGAVAHDAAGNLTMLGSRGYDYDLDSQLVRVREGGALRAELLYDGVGRMVRLTDSATGQITYRIASDFEWNSATNRAQIRIQLAGRVIAIHDTPHDPNVVPPSCSGSPSALAPLDPAGFAGLFVPGFAALLGLALLQARRRRAEAGLALSLGWAVSPKLALPWRVGVAGATAGVFVLVISIPIPLLGPGTAGAVSPASVIYYHGDHLGSSVILTGDTFLGDLLRRVLYRPYGGVVAETAGGSTVPPKVGFTGQRFEASAGLHDYGARWYDSNLGRFLQPDSIVPEPFNPQSLNRYSYVMNDPVNRIDPTGQFSLMSESASSGGWVFSGSVFANPFGYDVFAGGGTFYYGGGGSSGSPHPSPSFSEGQPQAQVPSAITAESFTFSQTIPMPGSQGGVQYAYATQSVATDARYGESQHAGAWLWLARLAPRAAQIVARATVVAAGAGPALIRSYPRVAAWMNIQRPADFVFRGPKLAPPPGLADFGKNVVQWGSEFGDALSKAANITAQQAARISPGQAAAARDFYQATLARDPYNYTAAARIQLMERILELQK